MQIKQLVDWAKPILSAVAVGLAGVVLLKVLGVRGVLWGSVLDWTCAAVACALAGR